MLTYMETVERVKNGTPLKCVGCAHRKQGLCCYAADTGELRGESIEDCTHYVKSDRKQRERSMTNEKELIYVSGQIRKIMSEQGLTQADMSRRINAGTNSICQWTHGDCMPRGKALDSMISAFGLPEDYFEMPDGWQPPDDPEFYELKPPQKKKIKQAKSQSEAKEVRQAEQQPADWMAETATMIQGVALLYGIDVGDLIRDALKVWMQKQAEEEENGE